ncbi:MAG: DUF1553 domain-containing protein [Verrucomicrobia bacterium]|nr:DUF1553 domain-containing protein [Verrucomicrobiota bacterium]
MRSSLKTGLHGGVLSTSVLLISVLMLSGLTSSQAGSSSDPRAHWAFLPVSKPQVPAATRAGHNEIDRFLNEKLAAKGLAFSRPASKAQWLRRVTTDLTGLPPTREEVLAFESDQTVDAKAKVIDRLLSSPRYGERWGRFWLDLARYADTHGGSAIGFTRFPFSYTYRDYVIRAFNSHLPYDRFIHEQIAADQLGRPEDDPTMAALGFLTVGMQYRNRHDVIDDQIDVITRGLLGLTAACARCHDHKYDPIPTADYYSLYASLAPSKAPDTLPVIGRAADATKQSDYERELIRRQQNHAAIAAEQGEVMRGRLRMQTGLYLKEIAKGAPEQDTSTAFLSYRTDDIRPDVLNHWRRYLQETSETDPVLGPWIKLSKLAAEDFQVACSNLLRTLDGDNGDPSKRKGLHLLATEPPPWNPTVLAALMTRGPRSMLEVADAYGQVFSEAHQSWLKSLLGASLEAAPGGEIIPDEDGRHLDINSSVARQIRRHLYGAGTPTAVPDREAVHLLNRPVHDNLAGRRGAVHELHLTATGSPPRAMALREDARPQSFHVFRRGNPIDRGSVVEPGFLRAVAGSNKIVFPEGQRRLALAKSLTAPENPLTRRVIVNWVWQHHFGQGLVTPPDDWGTRGNRPSHPELLDYLASMFAEEGWSIQKLQRRILLSAAYAQEGSENHRAREVDPENRLIWRMPMKRLDMEAMLDSLLAVSGELDLTQGGRPFDRDAKPLTLRRSVYAFVNRDIVPNLSSAFDAANPNACTARRPETVVPQQALFSLNSDFIQDRSRTLGKLAEQAAGGETARGIKHLYSRILAREPDLTELNRMLAFLEQGEAGKSSGLPWNAAAHALLAANEFNFID